VWKVDFYRLLLVLIMTVEKNDCGGYFVVGTAFDDAKWAEIIEQYVAYLRWPIVNNDQWLIVSSY